ncbi:MAG TPA: hypothetical protein PKD86_09955 [Gemmatales bacterium]|nr:hypothetical protein [Gemmatales bacterium]HMP59666.1 hypothetical protein [Gemmatales bacterium]
MSTQPQAGVQPNPATTGPGFSMMCPDDESIWSRYSANYEFPLSVATSVVLHLFVAMMAALASVWLFKFDDKVPELDAIIFAGGGGSGDGGGDPTGLEKLQEARAFKDDTVPDSPIEFDPNMLPSMDLDPTKLNMKDAVKETEELARGVRDPSKIIGDVGRGGPGRGGGRGSGFGTGDGDGSGPGRQTARAKRKERWSIVLPLHDPEQFKYKLIELQTMVLVPESTGRYRLYRDLSKGRPPDHTVETQEGINRLNRIWYTNTDQEVCQGMAQQLGLPSTPNYIAIFVPQELELEMAKKELAYRNLTEEQVVKANLETVFEVSRSGSQFVVRVREQKPKGR